MNTTPEALKQLYETFGGDSANVSDVSTNVEALKFIYTQLGGEEDVSEISTIPDIIEAISQIEITIPSGTVTITENGTHDVAAFETAEVNVPNPATGTISITENGTYDVTEKASAEVDVPQYPFGTLTIVNNSGHQLTILDGCLQETEINGQTYISARQLTLPINESTDVKVPLTIIKASDGTIQKSCLSTQYFRMNGFGMEGTYTATLNEGGLSRVFLIDGENLDLRYLGITEGINSGVNNTATITIARTD